MLKKVTLKIIQKVTQNMMEITQKLVKITFEIDYFFSENNYSKIDSYSWSVLFKLSFDKKIIVKSQPCRSYQGFPGTSLEFTYFQVSHQKWSDDEKKIPWVYHFLAWWFMMFTERKFRLENNYIFRISLVRSAKLYPFQWLLKKSL